MHDDTEDRHGEERRRHGQPEHETDIATRSRHDQYRQQRSTESESFDEAKGRGTGVQGGYQKYRATDCGSSEEMSMKRLTKPNPQTVAGRLRRPPRAGRLFMA